MEGLDHRENHILNVVFIMQNLVEGSARVQVLRTGVGIRATGIRLDARWVQATPRVRVIVIHVGDPL